MTNQINFILHFGETDLYNNTHNPRLTGLLDENAILATAPSPATYGHTYPETGPRRGRIYGLGIHRWGCNGYNLGKNLAALEAEPPCTHAATGVDNAEREKLPPDVLVEQESGRVAP